MTRFGLDLATYQNVVDLEPNINQNFRRIAEGDPDPRDAAAQLRDLQPTNLLTNGGFEIWQRGNGPFTSNVYSADRWAVGPQGTDTLSVSRDTTNQDAGSLTCMACSFTLGSGAGATWVNQAIESPGAFANRVMSLSIRVRTNVANAVRLSLAQSPGTPTHVYSTFHSGNGGWETLTVTRTFGTPVSNVWIGIVFAASCTAYIDNAMLVVGEQPADYVPLHPEEDLARCLRYYELLGVPNGGDVGVSGYAAGAGAAVRQFYQYRVIKAAAATVTRTGNFGLTNMQGQPIAAQVQQTGFLFYGTATAAGDCWAYNNSGNLVAESNP